MYCVFTQCTELCQMRTCGLDLLYWFERSKMRLLIHGLLARTIPTHRSNMVPPPPHYLLIVEHLVVSAATFSTEIPESIKFGRVGGRTGCSGSYSISSPHILYFQFFFSIESIPNFIATHVPLFFFFKSRISMR